MLIDKWEPEMEGMETNIAKDDSQSEIGDIKEDDWEPELDLEDSDDPPNKPCAEPAIAK